MICQCQRDIFIPRQIRIDAPNALQHAIIRGIERKAAFKDDIARENFFGRLSKLISELESLVTSNNYFN